MKVSVGEVPPLIDDVDRCGMTRLIFGLGSGS